MIRAMSQGGSDIRVLIDEKTLARRVEELGQQISLELEGLTPILVGVLRGGAVFHADLIRHISLKLQIDFISAKSYGTSTESSGTIQLTKDLDSQVKGRDLVLVEDIVDSGLTARFLVDLLQQREPSSIRICSLLSKPSRRKVDVHIDYLGFEVPDAFVVGYGLDFDQSFRNLPYIGILNSVDGIQPAMP